MIDKQNQIKPNETPILFVNFTNEEFIGRWDGKDVCKLGSKETLWMPYWLAVHCAKHLVDREMNSKKLPTDHSSRESFIAKCIGNKPEEKQSDSDPLGLEVLNKNMEAKPEPEAPAKKRGRPKEEEFEGLK